MRPILLSGVALAACGVDVEVQTVTYDNRSSAGEMDIHAPVRAADTPAPAVLVIHGGGWWWGSRNETDPVADRLARAGYVTANMDYRLVPDSIYPTQVQDVFCALSYLRAHADELGIDPQRIGVHGFSAGAHLAAMAGVAADVVELQDDGCPWGRTGPAASAVVGDGPYRLDVLRDDTAINFLGGRYEQDPDLWARASPITHVDGKDPPFLLIHAKHDLVIDIEQSEWMYQALRAAGGNPLLLRLEGGGHALNEGASLGYEQFERAIETPIAWSALIDFFDSTLGAP